MFLPDQVIKAMECLTHSGYSAYVVGGCVRDSLMGITPHDYDICTDCTPDEFSEVFTDAKIISTGIAHGTCTVIIDHLPIEITTFRSEENYSDHRRPDEVHFIKSHKEDMSRRDFTMNAVSFSFLEGYIDYYDGISDIKNGIIRCVGDPEKRFEEDALRILRAIRFVSCLGFIIEDKTKEAIFKKKALLSHISSERIASELDKMLAGKQVFNCITEYRDVLAVIMPEIIPSFDFEQNTKHHCFDVWTHIARSVELSANERSIRLCMLFHDIGKPGCATTDSYGNSHFKGHQAASAEFAKNILNRLKYDNKTKKEVVALVAEHDNRFECCKPELKRFLAKYGYSFFQKHMMVRTADTLAQSAYNRYEKMKDLFNRISLAEQIIQNDECYSLKQMKINGKDLMDIGITDGRHISRVLDSLLEMIINDEIPNDKNTLINSASKIALKEDKND